MNEDVPKALAEPTATDTADALALFQAYHLADVEAVATILTNCDPVGTLKAMTTFAEMLCTARPLDPCAFAAGVQDGLTMMRLHTTWGRET